ncbi:hypothetical protein [Parachlamydia sp.]|uniref:hypothetical protein n=1 Tax=Parachlamydia sp. TaxID=2052048 RepID=UPI003D0C1F90
MQCPSMSSLHPEINDVYTVVKPKSSHELKVILISAAAFPSMQLSQTTAQNSIYRACDNNSFGFLYYRDTRPESARPKLTTFNMEEIREKLTRNYAQLKVENGIVSSLTLSPLDAAIIKKYSSIRIVYYKNNKLEKKDKLNIGSIKLYSFHNDEFIHEYVEAAYRIQKILTFSIFPQKEASWFFKSRGEKEFKTGLPYIIAEKLPPYKSQKPREFLGYSTEHTKKTNSDTSFASAPPYTNSDESASSYSGSPESPPISLLSHHREYKPSSDSIRKNILKFKDLINEIRKILSEKKLNLDSNFSDDRTSKFKISMHFKRSSNDPETILLTTWLRESSREGDPSIFCYGVPMKVEVFANGSSEEFEFVYKIFVPVPFTDDDSWDGTSLERIAPKKRKDIRKCAMYEAYLQGLKIRYLVKSSLHQNDVAELAKEKFNAAYLENKMGTNYSLSESNFEKKLDYRYIHFKSRTIPSIGIGVSPEDPRPLVLDFRKKLYRMVDGKFCRIKDEWNLPKGKWGRKEKIYTGVDKNKTIKLEVDEFMFSPEYDG